MAKQKEKLTEADKKFIQKFFGEVDFSATDITRKNRFTEVEISVDPVFAKCYDFVMKIETALSNANLSNKLIEKYVNLKLQAIHPSLKTTNAVSNFDRARMIALKMDSNAYMELLD